MCICRIIFLRGASNNHNGSFLFFVSLFSGVQDNNAPPPRCQWTPHANGPAMPMPPPPVSKEETWPPWLEETLAEEARDSPGSLWEKLQDSATNYGTLMSDTAMQSALLVQFLHAFSCLAMSQNIVPMLCIEHFHMTTFQLAMIYTAGSGATFLASQPSAMIADKYGRKVAVVSGMSVMAATACTLPFLRASWLVNVAYVPYSVAISLAMAGFTPYFADLYDYDAHARSHSLALQRNVLDLGEIVGSPLLGALAASHFGFACGLHSTLLLGSAVCFGLFARETITGTAGGTPRRGTPKVGEVGGVPRSLVSPRGHRSKNGLLYTKSPEAPPQN